jgi:hypothetical protein
VRCAGYRPLVPDLAANLNKPLSHEKRNHSMLLDAHCGGLPGQLERSEITTIDDAHKPDAAMQRTAPVALEGPFVNPSRNRLTGESIPPLVKLFSVIGWLQIDQTMIGSTDIHRMTALLRLR